MASSLFLTFTVKWINFRPLGNFENFLPNRERDILPKNLRSGWGEIL